jgi:deoxyribodipyrimidine photo-lyase
MSVSVDHGFTRFKKMKSPRVPLVSRCVPKIGFHRRRFLVESLKCLDNSLKRENNSKLHVMKGSPGQVILNMLKEINDEFKCSVYCHEGESIEELVDQKKLCVELSNINIPLISCWGNTLIHRDDLPFDPETELPNTFSTFRRLVERRSKKSNHKSTQIKRGKVKIQGLSDQSPGHLVRRALGLPKIWKSEPTLSSKEIKMEYPPTSCTDTTVNVEKTDVSIFKGGEDEGRRRVEHYMLDTDAIFKYKETRNGMLGTEYSSKFSPWLAYGCISASQIYHKIVEYESRREGNESTYWLVFELLWRDFFRFYALRWKHKIYELKGCKGSVAGNMKRWGGQDKTLLMAWALGRTGVPLIDANMRELLHTGFMSNRGRQIVASFLVRDMAQDWRFGAMWFESMLIDHDPCSNYGNWTYSAGVGADPREDRYFHPVKQGTRYDKNGDYIRYWLGSEIGDDVPVQALLNPWKHGSIVASSSSSSLYPSRPIVDMMGFEWKPRGGSTTSRKHKKGSGDGGSTTSSKRRNNRKGKKKMRVQHF